MFSETTRKMWAEGIAVAVIGYIALVIALAVIGGKQI
jgi:hypothetical protein